MTTSLLLDGHANNDNVQENRIMRALLNRVVCSHESLLAFIVECLKKEENSLAFELIKERRKSTPSGYSKFIGKIDFSNLYKDPTSSSVNLYIYDRYTSIDHVFEGEGIQSLSPRVSWQTNDWLFFTMDNTDRFEKENIHLFMQYYDEENQYIHADFSNPKIKINIKVQLK